MVSNNQKLSCPKCNSNSITIHNYSTGFTITDIYCESYEIYRCTVCKFEFSTSYEK